MLQEVRKISRFSTTDNILKYWNMMSSELSDLALNVLTAQTTQVSVDRLFSLLEFVLSPLKANLNPNTFEHMI